MSGQHSVSNGPKRACSDCECNSRRNTSRRLKLKCNRIWPCSSCTRRKMTAFCPDGQGIGESAVETLSAKVASLEAELQGSRILPQVSTDLPTMAPHLFAESTPLISPQSSKVTLVSSSLESATSFKQPFLKHDTSDSCSSSPLSKDETEQGNAGLLIIMNDGESSTYVGGGATSAHRVELESQGTEGATLKQNFVAQVRQSLPPQKEAERYCNIYFTHGCLEYSVINESLFYNRIFVVIYGQQSSLTCTKADWAIFYLIMAIGCHFDPVSPWINQYSHDLFAMARSLLNPCDFEDHYSQSSVKALLLMGIYSTNARARGSEQNWSWLGSQMRIVQAVSNLKMGLHRDGDMFSLSERSVEARRRLFWECQTFDRLHSLSLGRPYAIADSQIDTAFPQARDELVESFQNVKFRLGQLRGKIADELFSTTLPSYDSVLALDSKLRKLERSLHPALRFTGGIAYDASFQVDSTTRLPDMHTMQSLYLCIMLQETTMCLHRSHFAKAMIEQDIDPLHSAYSSSVVAVMGCLPVVSSHAQSRLGIAFLPCLFRWAFLWVRSFPAGVCIGACITRFSDSVLSTTSMGDLVALRDAFTMADKTLCMTKRPLTKLVMALDTICKSAEGRSTPITIQMDPNLDLLRGTTHLLKRQRLEATQDRSWSVLEVNREQITMDNGYKTPLPNNGLKSKRASTVDQTALLEMVMRPNMEEYIAQLELSWSDLFPKSALPNSAISSNQFLQTGE